MKVVCNSTPLIALSKIDLFDLLRDCFKKIYIPEEVYREVVIAGRNLYGAPEVENADWIETKEVMNKNAVHSLCINLHKGEAEAIILAKEINADLIIIDDLDGKKIAKMMGLTVTGTLGILIRSAPYKNINLKETLDKLCSTGIPECKSLVILEFNLITP